MHVKTISLEKLCFYSQGKQNLMNHHLVIQICHLKGQTMSQNCTDLEEKDIDTEKAKRK